MSSKWTPSSWRDKPILQVPDYPDQARLKDYEGRLAGYPPLVFAGEARQLKERLGRVARGEAFCFKAVIVPKPLLNTIQTMCATFSASSCKWRLC